MKMSSFDNLHPNNIWKSDYQFTGKYSEICLEKNLELISTSSAIKMKKDDKDNKIPSSEKKKTIINNVLPVTEHRFPPRYLKPLFNLAGNNFCIECGKEKPEWASVSYGILLCLHCCGYHRGLGVEVSSVPIYTLHFFHNSKP